MSEYVALCLPLPGGVVTWFVTGFGSLFENGPRHLPLRVLRYHLPGDERPDHLSERLVFGAKIVRFTERTPTEARDWLM